MCSPRFQIKPHRLLCSFLAAWRLLADGNFQCGPRRSRTSSEAVKRRKEQLNAFFEVYLVRSPTAIAIMIAWRAVKHLGSVSQSCGI